MFKEIFKKKQKQTDLPSSYFVGEEYVKDPKRITADVLVFFHSPGDILTSEVDAGGMAISLEQKESFLRVKFEAKLSDRLLTNVATKHEGDEWILGYIAEIMPYLNQELLRQRHSTGHFLLRTYSLTDISQILIKPHSSQKLIPVRTFGTIASFPELNSLGSKYDRVYVRDLIDAMHAYFNGDYEESIRKSITSVETFIKFNSLRVEKGKYNTAFEETVRTHLKIKCSLMNEFASDVIMDAYRLRNEIVHDGKRLDPIIGKTVAKRVTHMVNEVYKNFGQEEELKKYAFYLEGQFLMFENYLTSDGLNLKTLESLEHGI